MDLKAYEQMKFELAEIIRAGELIAVSQVDDPNKRWQAEEPWRELLTRLAEDRFTVVVAGRFNRGKSSLMNALLGMDRLPTGVIPLTSVITSVRYGTSERVLLDYYGSRLRGEAKLEELRELVTEKGNPKNAKRIRVAEIQIPAEILRRGFYFVDTPGLGSAIFENSQTTEQFIPEIDVLILVTSYESPLTEDEVRFLGQASLSVRAVFVVVNKQDTASPETRQEVLDYVADTARSVLHGGTVKPFSVSARDGLAAKQANDVEALKASGVLALEDELIRFLSAERSRLFLSSMFDRVSNACMSLPEADGERLAADLKKLRRQSDEESESPASEAMVRQPQRTRLDARGVTPCEMCRVRPASTSRFLSSVPVRSGRPPGNSGRTCPHWRFLPAAHLALRAGCFPARCLHSVSAPAEPDSSKSSRHSHKRLYEVGCQPTYETVLSRVHREMEYGRQIGSHDCSEARQKSRIRGSNFAMPAAFAVTASSSGRRIVGPSSADSRSSRYGANCRGHAALCH